MREPTSEKHARVTLYLHLPSYTLRRTWELYTSLRGSGMFCMFVWTGLLARPRVARDATLDWPEQSGNQARRRVPQGGN
jgi:hypothetical protein